MAIKYLKPWQLLLYVFLSALKSFQIVFIAFIFQQFINYAQAPTGSFLNLVLLAVAGLLAFGLVGIIYQVFYANLVTKINLQIKTEAANYLLNVRDKEVVVDSSFMTNDLKQIETNKIFAELDIIYNAIQFLAAVIVAFVNSWLLSLIFLIASFIPAVFQNIFGPKIEQNSTTWEKQNSHYTETVGETIRGLRVINLYDVQNTFCRRLLDSARKMELALKKTNETKNIASEVTMTFAYMCGMVVPFSFGIYFVAHGQLTLGTFIMISQLANNFINPIVTIFGYLNDIKTTTPIWHKLKQIVAVNKKKTKQAISVDNFSELQLINAGVKVNHKWIFQKVSLAVQHGQKVLLKAPSGWGKSTLLNVLTGNLPLSEGQYLFNHSENNGNWNTLHDCFSFIQQRPFLFEGTLRENITLGRTVQQDVLDEVAAKAGLADLVADKGWDLMLTADGNNLSGGQNQRIEIARALLSNRPILLADEATSSLDKDLSVQIHRTILQDFPGTVIEVAHKVTAEEQAMFDQVVNLNLK
jgi:ATP-binding cassette subfamily C protein